MSDATATHDVTQSLVQNWNPSSSWERDPPGGNQRLKPTVYQPSGRKAIDPTDGGDRGRMRNVVACNVGRRRYPATRPGCGKTPPGFFV